MRLFARAREVAGTGDDIIDAPTLGALLDDASARYGGEFTTVLERCRIWINGDEPTGGRDTPLADGDEVAILPPVSGG